MLVVLGLLVCRRLVLLRVLVLVVHLLLLPSRSCCKNLLEC